MQSKRKTQGILFIVVVLVAAVGYEGLKSGILFAHKPLSIQQAFPQAPALPLNPPNMPDQQTSQNASASNTSAADTTPKQIVVDVAGAVKHPGVYHLALNARNIDALKAAGGPTSQANTDAINLAAPAQDGSQLYFPTRAQYPTGGAEPIAQQDAAPDTAMAASPVTATSISKRASRHAHSSSRSNKLHSPSQGVINLNTASAADLERVPDVGPSMAERIIAFRTQNHGFQSLDDLKQVRGVGPKKFAKMAPFFTVH